MLTELIQQGLLTCPTCRGWRDGQFVNASLTLDEVFVGAGDGIRQGLMRCAGCGVKHPIIDGIAVIFRDTGAWLRQAERAVMWRSDLAPPLERWLRGAWSEEEDPNWHRQMLAIYGHRLSGAPSPAEVHYEARRRVLLQGRGDVLALDAGCGLGQASLSLAALGARVLAVDLDMGALRCLSELLHRGQVTLPRWRHGGGDFVPETVTLQAGVDPSRVALVAADMMDPPLTAGVFDLALSYHLLDNVSDPVKLVRQLHASLKPGGALALATPYDWSPRATPINARLGESIRVGDSPDPADALRALLLGELPALAPELHMQIQHEERALSWELLRHARSSHVYRCHYVEAQRPGGAQG